MRRCHWIGWVGAAAPAADTKKPARSALFDGGLVDLQLRALDNPSKLARSFLDNKVDQSKRARVLMLLPSWLVSPLDGVAAMLVLLRPWTSTALYLEM